MLEDRHHHHARVVLEDFFGAVAVVHVKVDDGHTLQAVLRQRMRGGDGHVVVKTETHRLGRFSVVARRADAAKGVGGQAFAYHVHCLDRAARRAARGAQGVRHHGGIRIHAIGAAGRRAGFQRFQVVRRMHAGELLVGDFRRLDFVQFVVQLRGHQLVTDGNQPLGAFRVAFAHIVQQAILVGDEGGQTGTGELFFNPRQQLTAS